MDWQNILKVIESTLTGVGLQVLGAIVLYIVGRWLITFAVGMVQNGLPGRTSSRRCCGSSATPFR